MMMLVHSHAWGGHELIAHAVLVCLRQGTCCSQHSIGSCSRNQSVMVWHELMSQMIPSHSLTNVGIANFVMESWTWAI